MPWAEPKDARSSETARREYWWTSPRDAGGITDREWALIAPFMPLPRRCGRRRTTDLREVVNAVPYVAITGCQSLPSGRTPAIAERGRMLPKDFPPYPTVQRYFHDWRDGELWRTIRVALAMETRALEGREAQPTAGALDSQTVKTTEFGGAENCPVHILPTDRGIRGHPGL